MKKKYLIFISLLTFFLFDFLFIFSGLSQTDEMSLGLSFREAISLAAKNNLDIKLAKIDADYKRSDLILTKSIFDTILSAEANYEDDQLATASSFLGTKRLTTNYNFGVSKKIKTGTTIEIDLTNKRDYSDSSFVIVSPAHTSAMELTIKQPIGKNFFGLIDRGNVKITKLNIEEADLETLDRIERSLAEAEINYWKLALAYEIVEIKKKMLKKAESLHDVYLDRFARGTAEKPDIYASEVSVKMRQIDLEEAKNELINASNNLKISLNLNYDSLIKTSDSLNLKPLKVNFIDNLKEAIGTRRDYQGAHKKIEAKKIDMVLKKNSLWPEIDLVGSFKRNALALDGQDAISDIFNEDNHDFYLGLEINLPLENRKARANYNKALLAKEKTLIELKKLETKIAVELDKRVREVNFDADKIEKWNKIVKLQADKLKEEEKRFNYGRSNSDTLIRFENDYLQAQLNFTRSYLEYRISQISLEVAKNTLLAKLSEEKIIDITD